MFKSREQLAAAKVAKTGMGKEGKVASMQRNLEEVVKKKDPLMIARSELEVGSLLVEPCLIQNQVMELSKKLAALIQRLDGAEIARDLVLSACGELRIEVESALEKHAAPKKAKGSHDGLQELADKVAGLREMLVLEFQNAKASASEAGRSRDKTTKEGRGGGYNGKSDGESS